MSRTVSALRSLLLGLTLAAVAVPGVALAEPKTPPAQGSQGKGSKAHPDDAKGSKAKHPRPEFPMDGKAFTKLIEERIAHAKKKMGHVLEKREVPEAVKKQAEEVFDARAKELRVALEKATADGTVTKEEARAVRDLARSLRPKGKHPHPEGKGKDKPGKHDRKHRGDEAQGERHDGADQAAEAPDAQR